MKKIYTFEEILSISIPIFKKYNISSIYLDHMLMGMLIMKVI